MKKILNIFLIFFLLFNFYQKHPLTLEVSSENTETLKVPIIMYHSILNDYKKTGKYIITPKQFENDLIYLNQHNYHTISTQELINYVYYNSNLPLNPIILTFDDGHYNNYSYVYPLLKKYNMKASISIIGIESDKFSEEGSLLNNNYSYLTWSQIKELSESGVIEILNHTYNMHTSNTGISKKYNQNFEIYEKNLTQDLLLVDKKIKYYTGKCNETFTYPFGAAPKYTWPIIKELGFKASLSCTEGINYITHNPDRLYLLKRFNRPSGLNSKDFFEKHGIV